MSDAAMGSSSMFIRLPWRELKREFFRILRQTGFTPKKAALCSSIFTENSLDGVYSHGVNRFKRFVESVQNGYVRPDAEPEKIAAAGALERWHGNWGPGPLNAIFCTNRAMALALKYGIGCVALGHTNHWMRGGYYGHMAAKVGYAFMGWSNTIANMPAWGAMDCRLGNNPLVIAVPHTAPPLVLDMAMSQYSYGALERHALETRRLAVAGGYDKNGELSRDAEEIIASKRTLPAGYWKGSGLALLLDLLGVFLSAGSSTAKITHQGVEYGLSQVFLAFHGSGLGENAAIKETLEQAINDYMQSQSDSSGQGVRLPGTRAFETRQEHLSKGIPVHRTVWHGIKSLSMKKIRSKR